MYFSSMPSIQVITYMVTWPHITIATAEFRVIWLLLLTFLLAGKPFELPLPKKFGKLFGNWLVWFERFENFENCTFLGQLGSTYAVYSRKTA